MPIDTQNKRRAAAQMIVHMVMPVPSGTIGTAAREHATWLYPGITALAPVAGYRFGELYWNRSSS